MPSTWGAAPKGRIVPQEDLALAQRVSLDRVQVALGFALGTDHARKSVNNQDGIGIARNEKCVVGIVCDGCGSGPDSEVGALIGAKLLSTCIAGHAERYLKLGVGDAAELMRWTHILEKAREDVVAHLRVLGNAMGDSATEIVSRYFLFTALGFAITESVTVIFAIGDGVYILADTSSDPMLDYDIVPLGPFPSNAPPYLGYNILGTPIPFTIHSLTPTEGLTAVAVGTDGFEDYIAAARNRKTHPGTTTLVGSIPDLWMTDAYFRNPDALRRKLYLMNTPKTRIDYDSRVVDRQNGLLRDDTSIVVARVL